MHQYFVITALLISACGSNVFKPIAQPDPAEEAVVALDERKSDRAIDILTEALEKDPENPLYLSLMASAKAQKAGIDTTDLAIEMVSSDSSSGNAITALFAILPAANQETLELLVESVGFLNAIPADQLTEADLFKISIYNTALTSLQAKLFDQDGNGQLTIEELASMDEQAATQILSSLLNAENAASIYSSAGGTGDATASIGQILSEIDSQPGSSQAEKLKSFLGSSSVSSP